MPITITIEAADANEIRQLVQDLAGTIAGMKPEELPVDTKVSTLNTAPTAPAATAALTAQAPAAPPVSVTSATPTTQPAALQQAQAPTVTTTPVAPATPTVAPTAPTAPVAPAAPTAAPQYDFNQIASATMQLQEAGHNLYEIWAPFGIQALNQLPKERYAEYAAVLRQRGAKI